MTTDITLPENSKHTPKIVIIEDGKETLMLLSSILETDGYDVFPVQKSTDSFQSVLEIQPHVVLLDIVYSRLYRRRLQILYTQSRVPSGYLFLRSLK